MKKYIFILFFLLVGIQLNAQVVNAIGFKIGASSANQTFERENWSSTSSSVLGLDIGIQADFMRMKNFNLTSEIHFVQKGKKEGAPYYFFGTYKPFSDRFYYISAQVLTKYRLPLKAYLFAGPRLDFLIYNHSSLSNNFTSVKNFHFELGGTIGIGVELFKGPFFEIQYCPNLSNTYSHVESGTLTNVRTNTIMFLIGYSFDLQARAKTN